MRVRVRVCREHDNAFWKKTEKELCEITRSRCIVREEFISA